MAAGDRNKNGKATDYVRHAGKSNGDPECGTKNAGYVDMEWSDVTCKRCLRIIQNSECVLRSNPNNWASNV